MDITREVGHLVVYVACQQDATRSGNTRAVEYHRKFVLQSLDDIGRWICMAQAAVRFADAAARCRGWEAENAEHAMELRDAVSAYEGAREAVRKLEGQSDGH